jgi:hypothetical protein
VEWEEARTGFFIDLLVQVVLPVIYFALRYFLFTRGLDAWMPSLFCFFF